MSETGRRRDLFFEDAWQALSPTEQSLELRFPLGDRSILVQLPGEPWFSALNPALNAAEVAPEERKRAFTLKVFGDRELDRMPPFPLNLSRESTQGRIEEWCDAEFLAVASLYGMVLADRPSGRALVFYHTVESVPTWDRCAPFRVALGFLGPMLGCHLLHAAAVEQEGRALLLVGKGGSGKSSTALVALSPQNPFRFLSEDYTVLGPNHQVYPLYRTAKVEPSTLRRLPWLAELPRLGEQEEKLCLLCPSVQGRGAELAAIVWPDRAGLEPLASMTPMTALTRLAPSTLFQNPNSKREDFQAMARLCKSVPSFRLGLGDSPGPTEVSRRLERIFRESEAQF